MTRPQWWQKPVLNTAEDHHEDRRVTWIELFFDLFFVVTIGQLAHYLAVDLSWSRVLEYALLFVPVWWVWIGYTIYNERFETKGAENRLFVFLLMIPSAGMAVFIHGATGHTYTGFALSYAIARVIITFLWAMGAYYNKPARQVGTRYVIGFSVSIVLVIWSIFFTHPYNYLIFGIALFIDLTTPLTTIGLTDRLPKFSTTKMPERYGLFILIVLGEAIVSVVSAVAAEDHITSQIIFTSITGIAITFCIWWIYFYYISRRPFGEKTYQTFIWSYLHMPLVMSIAMFGACLSSVIILSSEAVLPGNVRMLMSFSIFSTLLFTSLIELTLRREKNEPIHVAKSTMLKIIAGILILSLGIFGNSFSSIQLLLSTLLLLILTMAYGSIAWYTQDTDKNQIFGAYLVIMD